MLGSVVRGRSRCTTMDKRIGSRRALSTVAVVTGISFFLCIGFPAEPNPQDSPRVSIPPRAVMPKRGPSPHSNMRVDVRMILVPVTVTDVYDRPVMDLPMDSFHLYEDNVEQKVVSLFREEGPVSIGFIFDASSSMGKRMDRSIAAIQQFLATTTRGDEFFLVKFNDRASLVQGFTSEADDIISRLSEQKPDGWTALLDAIYLGVQQMKSAKNSRKALFVLTDGGDNSSRYSESEIRNLVKEADVQIYAIGIYEPVAARGRTPEEASGQSLLSEIAEITGGRQYPVDNVNELPDIAAKIGVELRNQYVIGYAPANLDRDGKYRKVTVKLIQPRGLQQLRATHKMGYYAPSQ